MLKIICSYQDFFGSKQLRTGKEDVSQMCPDLGPALFHRMDKSLEILEVPLRFEQIINLIKQILVEY